MSIKTHPHAHTHTHTKIEAKWSENVKSAIITSLYKKCLPAYTCLCIKVLIVTIRTYKQLSLIKANVGTFLQKPCV